MSNPQCFVCDRFFVDQDNFYHMRALGNVCNECYDKSQEKFKEYRELLDQLAISFLKRLRDENMCAEPYEEHMKEDGE